MIDALGIERADLVTHDIGNMVGYAFAAQYPTRVARFVLMDAPLPGTEIHMQMRGEVEFGARSRTAGEAICVILTRRF